MIHTYEFRVVLTDEQLSRLIKHYNKPLYQIINNIQSQMTCTKINLISNERDTQIKIHIDAILALNSFTILEEHLNQLIQIHKTISELLLLDSIESFNQTRIDYRIDVKIENEDHRELILKLLHKTRTKHYHLRKTAENYDSTIQLYNKSMEVKVYDKEKERKAKWKVISEEERDVLRFEVALRNRHLKYNKKKKSISKELSSYLNTNMHYSYMEKVVKIFFQGNFYFLRDAEIILERIGISKSDRDMIREFMLIISTKSFSKAYETFSPYKIRKMLKVLSDAKIHPVPIPKNSTLIGYSIDNPLVNPVNVIFDAINCNKNKVLK